MSGDQLIEKDGSCTSEKNRVLAWTKDVAASTASEAPKPTSQAPPPEARRVEREPARVVVNQIVTTPAVVVTRVKPESPKDEIGTKAVIGTILGATAGAAVAYAMTKSQTETPLVEQHKRVAYKTIEAPVIYELVPPATDGHMHMSPRAKARLSRHATAAPPLSLPLADDLISRSEHTHHPSRSITRSHVEGVTSPPNLTNISAADSGNALESCHAKTARRSDFMSSTEARSAKDVPLPHSRVISLATEKRETSKAGKSSLSPRESVSQVSTRRSGQSGGSKLLDGHTQGSGIYREHRDHRSRTSKK